MENIVIVLLICVMIGIGAVYTVRHFQGKSSCCGGNDAAPASEEKKLNKIIQRRTFLVEGMHCDHCKVWVEKAVNKIEGVSCSVNLRNSEAIVSYEKEVDDKEILSAILRAGYKAKVK